MDYSIIFAGMDIDALSKKASEAAAINKRYFAKLKKRPPKKLDLVVQDLHHQQFERTDCLTCANCCKTTSPIFTDRDIERIAKLLRMKVAAFIEKFLIRDTDQHYMLKSAPCSFLDLTDNMCMIYDSRPKACREYPHTDRRKFHQITELTLKNTAICPAVYEIVEQLKKKIPY